MMWDDEIDRSVKAARSFGERMAERAAMARQDALDMDRAHDAAQKVNDARDRRRARRASAMAAIVDRAHEMAGFMNLVWLSGFNRGFMTGCRASDPEACECRKYEDLFAQEEADAQEAME